MKFAFVVPNGDRAPLRFVCHGHFRGDFVQNLVNAYPGDIWDGNELADGGAIEHLDTYDLIMINQNTSMYGITYDLADRMKHAKVTALDGGSLDDISLIPMHCKRGLITAARVVSMYFTFQPASEGVYKLLTDKPVRYLGCPVPHDLLYTLRKPLNTCGDTVAIGITLGIGSGVDRNGIMTAFAIQKALPGVAMTCGGTHDAEWEFARDYFPTLHIHKIIEQGAYWDKVLSTCKLGVILDNRYTWGRFAADCAGLGVPCIGVNRNGTQATLWPELTVDDPFKEMDKVIELIKKVWYDKDFYAYCIDYAWQALTVNFSEEATGQRLMSYVKELGIS